MTLLFVSGYDTNDFTEWTSVLTNQAVQNTTKHHGGYAMKCTASIGGSVKDLGVGYSDLFLRFYVNMAALPSSSNSVQLCFIADAATANPIKVFIGDDGAGTKRWVLEDEVPNDFIVDSPININQWYCVECRRKVGGGGTVELWIDGVKIVSQSTPVTNNGQNICVGESYAGENVDCYFDCVKVADAYIWQEAAWQGLTGLWH